MTSWRFEASNDMVHWTRLDTRHGSIHTREALQKMSKKGGTTTWGIDLAQHQNSSGYSCFRIVQIERNASGNDHLSLSGLEVYGMPTNPDFWAFFDCN